MSYLITDYSMNPFDFFKNIYCINLAHRTDRWENCLKEFESVGIKDRVQRFEAIQYKPAYEAFNRSMIECLKMGAASNEPFLILEDDVEFKEDARYKLQKVLDSLPKKWDILYLGGLHFKSEYKGKRLNDFVRVAFEIYATHAIAFNTGIAKYILSKYDNPIVYKNSGLIFDSWLKDKLQPSGRCYIAAPMIAWQKPSYSDLSFQDAAEPIAFINTEEKLSKLNIGKNTNLKS